MPHRRTNIAAVIAALAVLQLCHQGHILASNVARETRSNTSDKQSAVIKNATKLMRAKRFNEALLYSENCLQESARLTPDEKYKLRLCHLGALKAMKRYREASSELDQLIADSPLSLPIVDVKYHLNVELKNDKETLKFLNERINRGERFYYLYFYRYLVRWQLGDSEGALADLSYVADTEPTATHYYLKANVLFALSRNREALPVINTGLTVATRTESEQHLLLRANILRALGKNDLAYQDVLQALQVNPKNAVLYRIKGDLLEAKSKVKEALAAYEQCLRLNPKESSCAYEIMRLRMLDPNSIAQAIQDCNKAKAAGLSEPLVLQNRAEAYQSLGNLKAARADISRILELGDATTNIVRQLFRRGKLNERIGDREAAIRDYSKVLRKEEIDYVYARRGLVYAEKGDFARSRDDFTAALALNPTSFSYLRFRAASNIQQGKAEAALKDLNRCVELDKSSSTVLELRAKVFELMGRHQEAQNDRLQAQKILAARVDERPPSFKN